MSIITKLSELVNGHQTTVDLSANTLDVQALEVGGILLSQAGDYASFSGTISGTSTPVTITANDAGPIGNSVALIFSGSNSISSEISTWNTANPSNQVTLTSGNGTQIPSSQTVNLSGGSTVSGSSLIGDIDTYVNFTPTGPTVQGALEGIDAAITGGGGGSSEKVDKFTLDGTDISNGYIILSNTPTIANNTILFIENAPNLYYGIDFAISGNQLTWSSYSLNGILSSGDNLTVLYSSGVGVSEKVDLFTLDSTDISNGYVTLSDMPSIAGDTILLVDNAPNMFYGIDYEVSGNHLIWTGFSLNGILSSGDNLTVLYSS